MSFNRLDYDTCEYKQRLSESVGPGSYMINKPPKNCEPCYPFHLVLGYNILVIV